MIVDSKKEYAHRKGVGRGSASFERLELAAVGIEAEFNVVVDGLPAKPEDVFRDPRDFLGRKLMHRTGRSYSIPTGGAVYFDTGVIEVVTPVIEIDRGCAARAGRSLWEGIRIVRAGLDGWERRTGRSVRLVGFSTHYNVSFELPREAQGRHRSVAKLAKLLSYILPVPMMLVATNRRSTGVGVRPRGDRIEVTADFTPDASLMIAAGSLVTGIVRSVMEWPSFELSMLRSMKVPVLEGYAPMPHTSRKGWLARNDCYISSPFACDVDALEWDVVGRDEPASLRSVAREIFAKFAPAIRRVSDPFSFRLIAAICAGRASSLLELDDRPPAYEDVGRLCAWSDKYSEHSLPRSRYERVLMAAISGRRLYVDGASYTPVGMRGWTRVVFRRDHDRTRHVIHIDMLTSRLDEWEGC